MKRLIEEIPERGLGNIALEVIRELSAEEPRLGDKKSLGPMMSKPHSVFLNAFIEFIDRNLNDPSWFKITSALANASIKMVSKILKNSQGVGIITYGGSEANLTSLYIGRELGFRKIITSRRAHSSIFKSAKVLSLKVIAVNTDASLHIIPEEVKKAWTENRDSLVVLTAGNTETGAIDNVKKISELIPDAPIVIDGAYGGIMIPFLREKGYSISSADFSVNNVLSISIDAHKALLTPIPSGALILKDKELMKPITFSSDYLSSDRQVGLLWTKTGGSAAALWTSLVYYGKIGLMNLYSDLMRRTFILRDILTSLGFQVIEPELPLICFRHPSIPFKRLLSFLKAKGWYLYKCPSVRGLRITVLPHVTEEIIGNFQEDLLHLIRNSSI